MFWDRASVRNRIHYCVYSNRLLERSVSFRDGDVKEGVSSVTAGGKAEQFLVNILLLSFFF